MESTNHPKQSDFDADQLPNRHRRWHIVENSMQAKAQPEAQLGDSSSRAKSLGKGRSWQSPPNPSSIHQVESIGAIATILPKTSGHQPRHSIFAKAIFSSLNERAVLPTHTVDQKHLLTQKLIVSLQNFSATIQKPPR